jgi:hypothetical protein
MSMKNVTYRSQIIKYINDPRQPYGTSTSSSKFCYLSLDVVSWAWQLSQGCNQTVPQCMSTTTRAKLMPTNLHCQWEYVVFIQRLVLIRIQIDLVKISHSQNFSHNIRVLFRMQENFPIPVFFLWNWTDFYKIPVKFLHSKHAPY